STRKSQSVAVNVCAYGDRRHVSHHITVRGCQDSSSGNTPSGKSTPRTTPSSASSVRGFGSAFRRRRFDGSFGAGPRPATESHHPPSISRSSRVPDLYTQRSPIRGRFPRPPVRGSLARGWLRSVTGVEEASGGRRSRRLTGLGRAASG